MWRKKLPEGSQFGDEELIMVFRYKPDIKNVMRSMENWDKGIFPHMNVQSLNQGDVLYESGKLDEKILESDKKLQNITPTIQDIHPKSRQNDEKAHNSLQHTTHKRPSVFYEEVQDDENFLDAVSTTQIVHNLPEKHEDEEKLCIPPIQDRISKSLKCLWISMDIYASQTSKVKHLTLKTFVIVDLMTMTKKKMNSHCTKPIQCPKLKFQKALEMMRNHVLSKMLFENILMILSRMKAMQKCFCLEILSNILLKNQTNRYKVIKHLKKNFSTIYL
ncbi:hypothetical protein CEXT_180041 [Caerostris extrusa]|uniref:Uncharacterized protein n=1 Tax=Caerostris extrusa TaxID=172846 RepID=A0AAV4PD68_CAEEX|nr:hypothetical protein CEXT_180041 [Caerostris extrusa]